MKKKLVSILLAITLVVSTMLTGCAKTDDNNAKTDQPQPTEAAEATDKADSTDSTDSTTAEPSRDPLSLEVYDAAANYQGIANGWFANYVKKKFNLELNIIAPNVSGDAAALYQTRCSSGKLGDIILLDNDDFIDCIKAGLVKDITSQLPNYSNINAFSEQINAFAAQIEGANGAIYGIPTEMTNTSPTAYSSTSVLSSPMIPWDYYKELGYPEMKTSDDLLNVLASMQQAHPTNADGEKAYAISLWPDWDGTSIENVNQMTKWYGEEVNGSILLNTKGEMKSLTDENGAYYKMLHFLFKANQMGLIDPDSATQDWNTNLEKMKAKKAYLYWYSWSLGFYNSKEMTSKGEGYIHIPVQDMNYYQTSDSYYGSGRMWGVGAHVDEATTLRIMEFLDWYASPESVLLQNYSIPGFNFEVLDDGTYATTNDDGMANNEEVPEEWGGGPVRDGANQLNQWIVGANSINPLTNEPYARGSWSSEKAKEKSKLEQEWMAQFNALNAIDLMQKNNQVTIVPSINMVLPVDPTEIALSRSECGKLVCNTSWQLIYAKDEAAFTQGWADMKELLSGLGWDDLVAFDKQKYQAVVDARAAAVK